MPLVIFVGLSIGAFFAVILGIALRRLLRSLAMGPESLAHKMGFARDWRASPARSRLGIGIVERGERRGVAGHR